MSFEIKPNLKKRNCPNYVFRPTILSLIFVYRRVFTNYKTVILKKAFRKFPIVCFKRNGDKIVETNAHQELRIPWYIYYGFKFDISDDIVELRFNDTQVVFKGGINDGGIHEVFGMGVYNCLDVAGRVVIDVGGNIGDSAIYFALKGAKKVITVEPYPLAYSISKTNVHLNNLESKITIVNSALGCESGSVKINSSKLSVAGESAHDDDDNADTVVPVRRLRDLIQEYHIDDAVLKMDCEGCEYKIFNESDISILRHFSSMVIEYHHGPDTILSSLKTAGFQAKIPKGQKRIGSKTGILFAWRINGPE